MGPTGTTAATASHHHWRRLAGWRLLCRTVRAMGSCPNSSTLSSPQTLIPAHMLLQGPEFGLLMFQVEGQRLLSVLCLPD